MTQLVFDEAWVEPLMLDNLPSWRLPRITGQISVPWIERYHGAYDRWIDEGFQGAEPVFEDFIPTMTKEN